MAPAGRTVHQLIATLAPNDAVSNEALAVQDALRSFGFRSEIVSPDVAGPLRDRARPLDASESGDALLVHYSIDSPAVARALDSGALIVLRYHNVTPPEWLESVDAAAAELCRRARERLPALAPRTRLALAASAFSRADLDAAGFAATEVLPLLVPDDDLPPARADPQRPLVLTVGRLAPHKRIDEVLRVFALFQRACKPEARLAIVGSAAGFERHEAACRRLAERLGVRNVAFTGGVGEKRKAELLAEAAAYVSMSEHEGFGVPLVEAMRCRVPVLARAAAAVPETLGSGGLAVDTRDHAELAELLDVLVSDEAVRSRVRAAQEREVRRFDPTQIAERLRGLLEGVLR